MTHGSKLLTPSALLGALAVAKAPKARRPRNPLRRTEAAAAPAAAPIVTQNGPGKTPKASLRRPVEWLSIQGRDCCVLKTWRKNILVLVKTYFDGTAATD